MRRSIWIWGMRRDRRAGKWEQRDLVEDFTPTGDVCVLPIHPAAEVWHPRCHLWLWLLFPMAMCLLCPPESLLPATSGVPGCSHGKMWGHMSRSTIFQLSSPPDHLLGGKGLGFGGHHRLNVPAFQGIGFVRNGGVTLSSEQVKSCRNSCLIWESPSLVRAQTPPLEYFMWRALLLVSQN